MESIIRSKLNGLQPTHMQILNESSYHSRGSESHFNIFIVSPEFAGKSNIEKHQLVYSVLNEEMKQIHALTLTCKTPD
jgi:stress-induced morphogen